MKSKTALATLICTILSASVAGLTGCEYPEDDYSQSQQNADTARQSADSSGSSSTMTGAYNSGNPAALAAARRGAENFIDRAEQASQDVANQADEMMNPDR